jgi:hypothetical protein
MQPIAAFFAYRHKTPRPLGTPTKPQKKATAKAVKTLQKNAPQMLQGAATGAPVAAAASGQGTAGTAPVPTTGAGGAAATGNGGVEAAAPTGASHS